MRLIYSLGYQFSIWGGRICFTIGLWAYFAMKVFWYAWFTFSARCFNSSICEFDSTALNISFWAYPIIAQPSLSLPNTTSPASQQYSASASPNSTSYSSNHYSSPPTAPPTPPPSTAIFSHSLLNPLATSLHDIIFSSHWITHSRSLLNAASIESGSWAKCLTYATVRWFITRGRCLSMIAVGSETFLLLLAGLWGSLREWEAVFSMLLGVKWFYGRLALLGLRLLFAGSIRFVLITTWGSLWNK